MRRLSILLVLPALALHSCDEETSKPGVREDVTPPARIEDLRVLQVDSTSVSLRWTAPGDDDTLGTASTYDLRYSIGDTTSWGNMVEVPDLPVPLVSGSVETISVSNLAPESVYWFAVRTADEVSNWSATSNIRRAITHDELRPTGSWENVGAGMCCGIFPEVAVFALAVHDGDVVAAGHFNRAGATSTQNIAAWDGSSWTSLGAGLSGGTGVVQSLVIHEGDLIAGGSFSNAGTVGCRNVARWDGESWHALGDGLNGAVHALAVWNGNLAAGGSFTVADGFECSRVARWTHEGWRPLGTGMSDHVLSLSQHEGRLIAGGTFGHTGSVEVGGATYWDGSTWRPFDSSTWQTISIGAFTEYNGDLIAAGAFSLAAHPETCQRLVARWTGRFWSPPSGAASTNASTHSSVTAIC